MEFKWKCFGENIQIIQLLQIMLAAWSEPKHGNEDKNASLDLFLKTSNPTLILLAGPFF